MISRLKGTVDELGSNYAIIDTHGVGYKVYVTTDTIHNIKIGDDVTIYTYFAVREDAQDLYGFMRKSDKELFELLISVSGIGPKSALNILSLASYETLVGAIRTGGSGHLTKIAGIGRKTAEKIVLELRDKIGSMMNTESNSSDSQFSSDLDVIEALKSLGYDADESRNALKKINKEITDVGAKVKAALKILS
jgi:holliday junction DNA helicase RuvA